MVCGEVRRFIYFFLDDTLGPSRRLELERHLAGCSSCGQRVLIQQRLRVFVKRRLASLSAPDRLRSRLTGACRGQAGVS